MNGLLRLALTLFLAAGALAALDLASGVAAAQDQPKPGIPARGKGKIKMTPPDKKPEDKKGDGKRQKEEPEKEDPPEDPFETAMAKLAGWPGRAAREAAAVLALGGPEQEPLLLARLENSSPPVAAAICFVLGDVGGDAAVPAVQATAARRDMAEHLDVVFDALGKLDGVNAIRRVLPYLRHPKRPAREAAVKWLRGRLDASYAPRLEEMLGDSSRGTRLAAMKLLLRVATDRARAGAFELLRDPAAEVARAAADILSTGADEEMIGRLNRAIGEIDSRRAAYAIVALVLVEEKSGKRPYAEGTVEELLGPRGLRAPEKLNRGAAAVALADIGYDSENPEVDALLDREIVLTLLNTMGGRTYFKDYGSLVDLARSRFGKLTGILDRRPIPELWDWWAKSEEEFVARRALLRIRPERLERFRIRARSLVEPALPTTLFSTVAADARAPDALGIGFVYLPPEEAVELAKLVSEQLLSLPDRGSIDPARVLDPKENAFGPEVIVNVTVDNRSRTLVGRRGSVPAGLAEVLERLRQVRTAYEWQRYWDRDSFPRYEDFITKESAFFAKGHPEEVRAAHLKDLILAALDDLATGEERTAAVASLAELAVPLGDSEAYRLALLMEKEDSLTPFAERVVRVLSDLGRPLVLPVVTDWFERNPGRRSMDLFVGLLSGLGSDEVEKAASSDRVFLKRAAVRAAPGTLVDEPLKKLLRAASKDDVPRVRREALLALGRTGARWALPMIEAGGRDPEEDVASTAIQALGILALPEVIPSLVRELGSDDPARRVATVTALCRTKLDAALTPVLLAISGDPAAVVRGVAAREVSAFGDRALKGLSRILTDPREKPAARAQIVDALVRIGGDHVLSILVALVSDPEEDVADAAAWALAARANKAGAPRLLAALGTGRNPVRTLAALEQLSCQSFPTARLEEQVAIYRGWWEEKKGETEAAWFVTALRRRGHEAKALDAMADGGRDEEVIPILIRALADGSWFIRANANLWLTRITTERLGEISRFTSEEDIRQVQSRWRTWWEGR